MRTVSGCPPDRRTYLEIKEEELPPSEAHVPSTKGGRA